MIGFAIAAAVAAPPSAADPAYDAALGLRRAGRAAEAAAAFGALSAERPNDPDVWLNLGLSQLALGRNAEAETSLTTALRLAPGYRDAQIAYARAALYRGDRAEASRRAAALPPSDPEAEALKRQIDAPVETAARWRLDAYASYSRLTKGLPGWRLAGLAVGRSFSDGSSLSAMVEHTERFDIKDTYFEVGGAKRLGGGSVRLAFGAAPDADYRPEAAVLAGATTRAFGSSKGSIEFSLDGAWRRLAVGDVRTLQPAITFRRGDALELTALSINTWDERDTFRSGYAVRAGARVAPRLKLLGGWSNAPESSQGVTLDVRSVSFGAQYELDARTALRFDGIHEDRPGFDRDELAIAFTRRF